ncbi:MAG: SufD family Fe-S cluster assembly protein [Chloroflexota bacterium]
MTEATTEPSAAKAPTATPRTATPPATSGPAKRKRADLTFVLDRDLVDRWSATEPDWLTADRRAAAERFDALPIETNRLYTPYVDLRTTDLTETRAWEATATEPAPPTRGATGAGGGAPDGDPAAVIELREDRVAVLTLGAATVAAGVTVETLGALIARDARTAQRLLTNHASIPDDDRLAQLTRAGWNQGIAIRVPAGVRLDRPIVVRWLSGNPDRALLTRTIVELGAGATATLVEELRPSGPDIACAAGERVPQSLFTGSMELHLGSGADLAVASLQELGERAVVFQHRMASIGDGANLRWAMAQLGGKLVRSRIDNRLEGDRSTVEQVEIVFAAEDQLFDLTSYTRHIGRDTTGSLLSKGVLFDKARSYMKGLISIEKTAIGTDSFLGEFGMNLSRAARAVAIPSLEIDQPDCRRAMHSSSVGPIDETQLFYLESRGIPPDEARKFIVLGFLEPVVARVPLEESQDRLRQLLEDKWAAGLARAVASTATSVASTAVTAPVSVGSAPAA